MVKRSPPLAPLRLGRSGLTVSRLGLGCMPLSGAYGPVDPSEAMTVVVAALNQGINFFDTADLSGDGASESLLGACLATRRDDVVIASKFGQVPGRSGTTVDCRPAAVREACEASLKRLKTDRIDLYYAHRIDPDVPIEDTVGAMAALVHQGKVRAIGLCEANPDTIQRADKTYPLAAVQHEYSLLQRTQAEEILQLTKALGIAFVAYAPFGRGLLTGAIRATRHVGKDIRAEFPAFAPEHFHANMDLVERLAAFAKSKHCTPSQLALAWLLGQDADLVPIPGTRSLAHLDRNIAALKVDLTPDEVDELSLLIPPGAASGDRYPAAAMAATYR